MGIGILRSLPTKQALLHHIDECRHKHVVLESGKDQILGVDIPG
jgi:hypothetical protein